MNGLDDLKPYLERLSQGLEEFDPSSSGGYPLLHEAAGELLGYIDAATAEHVDCPGCSTSVYLSLNEGGLGLGWPQWNVRNVDDRDFHRCSPVETEPPPEPPEGYVGRAPRGTVWTRNGGWRGTDHLGEWAWADVPQPLTPLVDAASFRERIASALEEHARAYYSGPLAGIWGNAAALARTVEP